VIPHGSRAWSTTRQQVFDRRVQDLGQKPEVVRCWEAFSTLPPKDRSSATPTRAATASAVSLVSVRARRAAERENEATPRDIGVPRFCWSR